MKRWRLCLISAILAALLAGCASGPEAAAPAATEAAQESARTVVTMMYTTRLEGFEALVEETYPDIDLQVEINAEATLDGESERRLHNGHGTSIITTSIPTGDVRNYAMDLSAEPYVDRYQTAIFQNVSDAGRTLFIPLPGQYYGYIYNRTLLERAGIPVPETQLGILDMLDAAAAQGVGVGEDGTLMGVVPTITTISSWLMCAQVPDFLSQSDGIIWNQKMLAGEAKFTDGMRNCLDFPRQLVDRGYINAKVFYLNQQTSGSYAGNATPINDRMLDGKMLITYESTRTLTFLNQMSDDYEFGILPFLSDEGNPAWTITIPDAYLTINAALAEPGREAERDAASRVLDLLSTPEGQRAYIRDCGIAHSYLSAYDYAQGGASEDDGLKECIEGGYVYNIRIAARVLNYFGRQMIAVLNDALDLDEALASVDDYNLNGDPGVDYDQSLVGLVAEDLIYEDYNVRREETALGNLVADAVRERTGVQFAFVNGGSIRSSLYAGNVFGADVNAVYPYVNYLVCAEVDGATIRAMLANGISTLTQKNSDIPGGRFLNVSGLCYSFRPPEGDAPAELVDVTLPDGSPIEDGERYTIAVTNYMCGSSGYFDNNGDGYTMLNLFSDDVPKAENVRLIEETGYTAGDALRSFFANHSGEAITSRCEGRIKVVTGDD